MDCSSDLCECYHCGSRFEKDEGYSCKACTTKHGYGLFCNQVCMRGYCDEHFPRDFYMDGDGEYPNDCERCLVEGSAKHNLDGFYLCNYCVLCKMGVFDHGRDVYMFGWDRCGSYDCRSGKSSKGNECMKCDRWFCKRHKEMLVLGLCYKCRA